MSGGSPDTVTQINKTEPWKEAKPHYLELYKAAEDAFQATPNTPFAGNYLAQPGADQHASLAQLQGVAPNLGQGAAELRNLGINTARGDFLSGGPYMEGAINAALNPIQERYQNQIIPQLQDAAVGAGAYGGNALDIEEGNLAQQWLKESTDISSRIMFDNYARERQLQQGAPGLLNAANSLELMPGTMGLQFGEIG